MREEGRAGNPAIQVQRYCNVEQIVFLRAAKRSLSGGREESPDTMWSRIQFLSFAVVIAISSCQFLPSTELLLATVTLSATKSEATPTQAVEITDQPIIAQVTHTVPATITLTPLLKPTTTLTPTPVDDRHLLVTLGEFGGGWPAIPVFSPDRKMIALVSERVRLWDINTFELIFELEKPYTECYTDHTAFSADSNFIAASIYCRNEEDFSGHLLIWDTRTGTLLHDWEQRYSKNTSKVEGVLNNRPTPGLAFFSEGTLIAYGDGNKIVIRDVRQEGEPAVLELGDEMFATDLSISDDGKQVFVFMDFDTFDKNPARIFKRYSLEIWQTSSEVIELKIRYPDSSNTGRFLNHGDVERRLDGKNLIYINHLEGIFEVTDLETSEVVSLPYLGDYETYLSPDGNYVLYYLTVFVQEEDYCNQANLAIWNADAEQALYSFSTPDTVFDARWCYGYHAIVFNQDNTLLAIAHDERVTIWDISEFIR